MDTSAVWVIIPGLNEAEFLPKVLRKIGKHTKNIVYVDDGSVDGSADLASREIPHVLRHETNIGKGAALKTGCEFAFEKLGANAVIFMDADDQHDPNEIPKFISALRNFDVIFGVRNLGSHVPLLRFLGNKSASVLLNLLYGAYIADIPSGFKAISKRAFECVHWKSSGYEVETEIAMRVAKAKLPYTTIEIDAIYHDTDKGMTLLDGLHICRCLIQWRLGL